ncbi:hypothetical protein U2F26_33400 [Micromonospora sp. 4G57]|uniref:Uncharacterized protein n=1 Tax=Micromonospora sicca TaxID=2202420 RepID=A0ABU5JP29_9ACTN|nr:MULTISPECIES: hypothetical protein [unclassified Micromonospora]MDZ5447548.1 hypothetical protein [Micromonospora sp. 4G57]MDZ5494296.1 hypothetical protein [Micromonospora sp. 4G53]
MPGNRSSRNGDRNPNPRNDQSLRPSRARLILPATAGTILAAWFTAALHNTLALVAGAILTASVLYGVVYPAVWSRCPRRRRAARRVLRDLLRWMLGRL